MKLLSRIRLFVTPWTAVYQAPPSVEFSRQEYWSGVPSPSPCFSCVQLLVTIWTVAHQAPLCPWDSPGKNMGVGSHSLFQRIFLTQGSNPGLLHCRWVLYRLSHQGSLCIFIQLHQVLVATHRIFVAGFLVVTPGPPALGAWNLSHWTIRDHLHSREGEK